MEYKGMKEDERLISVTPSKRQIAYQNMEYFCFIHFTVNTFTGSEWGLGDEPESTSHHGTEIMNLMEKAKNTMTGIKRGNSFQSASGEVFCMVCGRRWKKRENGRCYHNWL